MSGSVTLLSRPRSAFVVLPPNGGNATQNSRAIWPRKNASSRLPSWDVSVSSFTSFSVSRS